MVGRLTYVATDEGWLYPAKVIDLFSREVVGWLMRPDMHRSLVTNALEMAWQQHPEKNALLFHSPCGDFHCGLRGFRKDRFLRPA